MSDRLDCQKVPVKEVANNVSPKPLVSVCVQTYQHHDFIEMCLNSILSQRTKFDFEIIVGEDQSTDGTRDICIRYAIDHSDQIRLFLHDRRNNIRIDGKPTGRFNFLYNLMMAKGKYVAICEGDDYWTDPDKLQKQVDFLEANSEFSICYTDAEVIGTAKLARRFISSGPYTFLFTDSLQAKNGPTNTILFRRSILNLRDLINATLQTSMADWQLECLLTRNNPGYRMNMVTAVYRRHPSGATYQLLGNFNGYFRSRLSFFRYLYDKVECTNDSDAKVIARLLSKIWLVTCASDYREKGVRAGIAALRQFARYFFKSLFIENSNVMWRRRFKWRWIIKKIASNLIAGQTRSGT